MARRIDRGRMGAVMGIVYWLIVMSVVSWLWVRYAMGAEKTKVELTASPRVAVASPYNPVVVTLRLTVTNGDDEYRCPGIRWVMPDGTESYQEADCEPDEEIPERQSWSKRVALTSGEWTFVAQVERAGKVISKRAVTVHIG